MIKRALLFCVLLFTLIDHAAPANGAVYAGQVPETAPVVMDLVSDADAFMDARGVRGAACAPDGVPTVWQAPDLGATPDGRGAWGRGDGTTCEIWLSDALVHTLIYGYTFVSYASACQAIYHEVGHARGLAHTRTGLMAGDGPWGPSPDAEPWPLAWTPAPCLRWAKGWWAGQMRGLTLSEPAVARGLRAIDRALAARRDPSI